MKKCIKKLLAFAICSIMVLSCSVSALAATSNEIAPCSTINTYTFYREQGQAAARTTFYYDASKGSSATFHLTAYGTSSCSFRCEITTTSVITPTILMPDVLGNDSSGESKKAYFLTSGWYQVVVIPVSGTTNGNTITMNLTVTQ